MSVQEDMIYDLTLRIESILFDIGTINAKILTADRHELQDDLDSILANFYIQDQIEEAKELLEEG